MLRLPVFAGCTVCGGAAGLGRRVSGVNLTDTPDYARWLAQGELLITTGFAIADDPQAVDALLPTAAEKGLSGVGIKPGRYLPSPLPAALAEKADRLGLPLLQLPTDMRFAELADAVSREIARRRIPAEQERQLAVLLHHLISGAPLRTIMIAKIKTRADFRGIVNYANDQKNKKKSATLLAHEGVCAINNKTIADSFQIQTSMRPKVKSPVKHVSLAFSPQDTVRFPNDEKGNTLMVEIAKKWMEQMGIRNTQYIITRHHDTEHPHCHIVFNRIDNDGNLISDSNERIRNAKVCRALTKEYKLYFAPKNSKARNKSRLRPHQLRKYNLRSSTLDALAASRSWHDFFHMLKEKGIDVRFNHAENSDNIRGISFCMDEFSIAGSKLDSDLSFNRLCATLGNVATELIVQPYQAIVPSAGGGTNNEQGWRDDKSKDNQRNEPFYKTSKRRR
mgnify:CR=1 FL=1